MSNCQGSIFKIVISCLQSNAEGGFSVRVTYRIRLKAESSASRLQG